MITTVKKAGWAENPFLRHLSEERKNAGRLSPDEGQTIRMKGLCAEALDFVAGEQLCDRGLWRKFVEQFRLKSDSEKREWRGEYWGKMMRGAAFVVSVTKDDELYCVLEETVRDLLSTQEESGRFSTYTVETEYSKWDMWVRKYVLLGLLCFRHICRDAALSDEILTAAKRHADVIVSQIGRREEGKLPIEETSTVGECYLIHGAMNSLSILEPMVLLYRETKEPRYLEFASYLVQAGIESCGGVFRLARENRLNPYQYSYTKAYEMMSCFEGLLEYALETGSVEWLETVKHFAYRMAQTDITMLGSAGTTGEFLDRAAVHQVDRNDYAAGQETCVSVTWMKFCSRMLLLTGDPLFGDCFEQTLYNAYLGTLNREHIANPERIYSCFLIPGITPVPSFLPFDSYTPLLGGIRGQGIGGSLLFQDGTYYGCCACIASVGIGIAPYMAFLRAADGFSVQLYERGTYRTVTPAGKNITFGVDTAYPAGNTVLIRIDAENAETMTLSFRIPSWSLKSSIFVNGDAVPVTPGMTEITREWQTGDTVELQFDLRVEAIRPTSYGKDILRSKIRSRTCEMVPVEMVEDEKHMRHVALRRGPLILAQDARLDGGAAPVLWPGEDVFLPAEQISVSDLSFPAVCCVTVYPDGKTPLRLIDCASAGRTWRESSAFVVWLDTEEANFTMKGNKT